MARIDSIARESMSPEIRALLSTRPPYKIYSVLANAPTALPGFIQLASALLTKSELDPKLREMVILRVGALCNSAYEMHQHIRLARHVGVSEEQICRAMDIGTTEGGNSLEGKLLAFTDSVVRLVKAPTYQFDAVRAELSPRGVTELLMIIGTYMMVSRVLENLEVEIEESDVDIAGNKYYPNQT